MALIPRSLSARLVLVTTLITALVVAVVVVLVQVYLGRVSESDSTELARARADAVASTVRVHDGRVVVLESGADSLDRDVWVFDGAGRLVEGRLTGATGAAVRSLASRGGTGSSAVGGAWQKSPA